ncbi:MAG: hypothetical protein ACI9LF_001705, partial [Flavobacteriales bacterium]
RYWWICKNIISLEVYTPNKTGVDNVVVDLKSVTNF